MHEYLQQIYSCISGKKKINSGNKTTDTRFN